MSDFYESEKSKCDIIFENTPFAMFLIDDTEHVVKANTFLQDELHLEDNEVEGLRPGDFFHCLHHSCSAKPCGFNIHCHECELRNAYRETLKTHKQCKKKNISMTLLKDGEPHEVIFEISSTHVVYNNRNMVLMTINDITEVQNTERELSRQRAFLESLISTTQALILVLDKEGIVKMVNPAILDITGYHKEELIGENWIEKMLTPEVRKDIIPIFKDNVYHNIQTKGYVNPILTKFGEERYIRWYSNSIIEKGTIEGVLATGYDVTEEVTLQKKQKDIEEQVKQAQKLEAIGTLAGGIAHDFNNILGAIIGFTELSLFSVDRESPLFHNLSQIMKASNRASALVQQILTFSREKESILKPLYLKPLVDEVLKLIRSVTPSSIQIKTNFEKEKTSILGDSHKLHEVLLNLCTNASHAMNGEGILTISVQSYCGDKNKRIPMGNYTLLSVSDTGEGIPAAIMDKIFEPFFSTKDPQRGTGMGLAMVYGVIKEMEGEIVVDSYVGKGTTFQIYIPAYYGNVEEKEKKRKLYKPPEPKSIIIVDDEVDIVTVEKRMLEALGYKVVTFTNGLEALEFIKEEGERYDLLVTDQTMPSITGINLAQKVKKYCPNIPIIVCTGYSEHLENIDVEEIGVTEVILKPVPMSTLSKSIFRILFP